MLCDVWIALSNSDESLSGDPRIDIMGDLYYSRWFS